MGPKKAHSYTSDGRMERKNKGDIHPIWRGVGIFLIVLIPVLGYLGSLLILKTNQGNTWIRIPSQLIIPGPDPLLLVKAILTVIIGSFVYFVLMLITFVVYRIFGPSRMGPLDVPPLHWKTKSK
jgi:quinol-cytochrome oxidoreductase complex cytochrome b subunit